MRKITSIAVGVLIVLAVWVAAEHSPVSQAPKRLHETVVYSSIQPPNWDLYIFDHPGAAPRRLTTDPGLDYDPTISPDGRWVVFTSERNNGGPDLYALDLQNPASAPRQLTKSSAMEDAAAFSPDGRQLVFVSTESGNPDIWVMPFAPENPEAAAAKARNLTRHPAGDYRPRFSPDGQWIAFSSNRDAPGAQTGAEVPGTYQASDVYVMRADGTGVQRLTRHEGWDGSPAWTPDGQGLVFYSEQDGEPRIFRMNRDGSAAQAISAKKEAALSPTFTPGGRLSFTVRRDGRWTIVSTQPDGSDLRLESDAARDYWGPVYDRASGRLICYGPGPTDETSRWEGDLPGPFLARTQQVELPDRTLTLHAVRGYIPALSPDATEVATSEAFSRLVISRLDGSHKRTIFDRVKTERYRGENSPWGPAWSADGKWLAFAVGAPFGAGNEKVDIWKSRPDGSEAVNLTPDSPGNDAWPHFSPDGRRIVFRSARDGNQEIYLMNADGTGVRRLTNHPATDTMPAFSSHGDRIAFTSQRDGGDYEIYMLQLNADGSPGQLERITNSPGRDMHPRFSPDDKWLLFTSQRGGLNDELPLSRVVFLPQPYGELHAIRLADKALFRLTHNKWEDGPSAWK
jgi:Tol biopolymer transport system component